MNAPFTNGGILAGLTVPSPHDVGDIVTMRHDLNLSGHSRSSFWIAAFCLTGVAAFAEEAESPQDPVAATFHKLDTDGNGVLSLEEYVQLRGQRQKHERDFQVFDFDGNRELTREEFTAIPGWVPPSRRGELPDPFNGLLKAAVAALDQSYNGWSEKPNLTVPSRTFVIEFLASIHPQDSRRIDPNLIPLADPDGDGRVTWQEARRFLEIQLGLRWTTGHPLRRPNGQYLMIRAFTWVDANKDWVLTKDEFLKAEAFNWVKEDKAALFERGDLNGDGMIDLDEYSDPDWVGYEDPVAMFLRWDTNLDGFLDLEELETNAWDYVQPLVKNTFPAFDLNGDGKLSLDEFQLSMLGNRFISWLPLPTDRDQDRILTFDEFTFDQAHCHLLRRFYFHRLDRNEDGRLTPDEFSFQIRPSRGFHLLSADGSEFRQLYLNDDFPNCGSPAVSPDGRWIAFDGYRGGATVRQSRLLLINANGSGFRDLGEGLMPTWSPDGTQLACSKYENGSGIYIINLDGSGERRISDGWGAQWSPDGQTIAYTKNDALWAYGVATEQHREVLPRGKHPFQYIYYNMGWSPDSRRLAFKSRQDPSQYVLASVDMMADDPDLKLHLTTTKNFDPDLCFSPDGKRILFSMQAEPGNRWQLHQLEIDRDAPPTVVVGIVGEFSHLGGVTFIPDGRALILVTRK